MTAFGYIRKSVMPTDGTRTHSLQDQEDRIRALAKAHGDEDLIILRDTDVSGAKVQERHGYVHLLEAIESGEAHAVYALDLSRLHREVKEALRFFELCRDKQVAVRLVLDSIDTATATGRLVLTVLAAMHAWYSQQNSERGKARAIRLAAEGRPLGGRRYGTRDGEDPQVVVTAYRDTQSTLRAARLLNEQGVPTRNGATKGWSPTAVKSVVAFYAPDLLRDPADHGIRGSSGGERKFKFARLLRCSVCGGLLTGAVDQQYVTKERRVGYIRYSCHNGTTVDGHGRTQVAESAIVDAILPEVEHAVTRSRRVKSPGDPADDATFEAIVAERARVKAMYRKGRMEEDEFDAAMLELDEQESRLSVLHWVRKVRIPPDVRSGDASIVNEYLRHLFERVTVDMSQRGRQGKRTSVAIEATWRDEAMRSEEVLVA